MFWLLLMAHGNFVAPRFFTFDVETAGDSNRGGRSLRGMLGDAARNAAWLAEVTGLEAPRLVVEQKTLRAIGDAKPKKQAVAAPAPKPAPAPAAWTPPTPQTFPSR